MPLRQRLALATAKRKGIFPYAHFDVRFAFFFAGFFAGFFAAFFAGFFAADFFADFFAGFFAVGGAAIGLDPGGGGACGGGIAGPGPGRFRKAASEAYVRGRRGMRAMAMAEG